MIEFEQIYDEYIQLCDNQPDNLASEDVFVHILEKSIFLNPDEKLAIVQGELTEYLATMRAQDKIFEMAAEGSNRDEEDGVLSSSG